MRGAVSLAAALALPPTTDAGEPFDERPVILFIVFCVILGTLVLQGLSLPWLIRLLDVETDDGDVLEQEARARLRAAEAALERIDDLEREDWTLGESIDRLRGVYRYRRNRFAARFDDDIDHEPIEERSTAWGRMMFEVIDAQRDKIEDMRRTGEITDEVKRNVERDLDLEERRLSEVGLETGRMARDEARRRRAGRSASASRSPARRRCRSGCPPPPCRRGRGWRRS